jgi:enamine deaminase RidA (YjgF/YER057c/UK114 family)
MRHLTALFLILATPAAAKRPAVEHFPARSVFVADGLAAGAKVEIECQARAR